MKKSWTMRVGVALVALTLVTSCFVGGTFAKYITSDKAENTARVAKWGVTVTATGDMFSKEYNKHDTSYTLSEKTVSSTENVVAPGTSGSLGTATITGTPEVAGRITREATVTLDNNWFVDTDEFYFPLTIKVNNVAVDWTTAVAAASDYAGKKAAVESAIKTAIENCKVEFAPAQDLSAAAFAATANCAVAWEWDFDDNGAGTNDAKDTKLGDKAANGNAANIEIGIKTIVAQAD